ncbi:Putative Glycoside hydrolase family 61 protein [Aspergillus calidoustus]|uniref:Putative Glycoside hydrolase family 61 protein n=1 Tax=Aspergillus calidoustus TaxID=454130 RepID=A0A0U5CRA3_ASPCI|nr:Putative Glycoside hydrolase family 61 protein [Aspergillus calidoustus]
MKAYIPVLALAGIAAGQAPAWTQCGGIGYTGTTTCVAGYACKYLNDWYSQCQPGNSQSTSSSTTLTTMTSSTTSPSTPSASPTDGAAHVRYLGRVNPATRELTWPGTGVAFTFTGTSATVDLDQVTGANSLELTIDNGEPIVFLDVTSTTTSISTPSGLSYGTHTVELRKRSESYFGAITIGTVTTDGSLISAPAPARKIEIIGDSITVGYGLDGVNPCTNTAALENNPKTYAALAAKAVSADYSIIAWSGKGLVRNIATGAPDDSPLMTGLYTRYGANDADGSYPFATARTEWTPDAVVITLGTNDFGYLAYDASGTAYPARPVINATDFTAGMVAFVRRIQTEYYPDAEIHFFLSASPMLSDTWPTAADAQHTTLSNALKSAVEQIGTHARFVDWQPQGAEVGCDYHPNAATNAAQGVVLAEVLGAVLGW